MNDRLALVTNSTSEQADRIDGLYYNALYMYEWQIKRVQSGKWDALSAPLLERGLATARRVQAHGQTYGRFDKPAIMRLIVDGERLLANVKSEAA